MFLGLEDVFELSLSLSDFYSVWFTAWLLLSGFYCLACTFPALHGQALISSWPHHDHCLHNILQQPLLSVLRFLWCHCLHTPCFSSMSYYFSWYEDLNRVEPTLIPSRSHSYDRYAASWWHLSHRLYGHSSDRFECLLFTH